jgi:large subunit ribosomal protein L17
MRHQKTGRKLARTSAHRRAMFSNMIASLVMHERIETTDAKAKELKRLAERTISWGTSVGDLLAKGRDKLDGDEKSRVVHAMRMAGRTLRSREALDKLFAELAPRYRGRPGGYTRVLKTRVRVGDAAPMSFVELVDRAGGTDGEKAAPGKDKPGAKKGAKAAAAGEPAAATKKPRARKKSDDANA